jgi:hypothetical protein
MKKRIVGAALFGIGLFFLVIALALVFFVVPLLARIPYDLTPPLTTVEAHGATFVQSAIVNDKPTATVGHADLRSTTGIKPDASAAAGIGGDLKNKAVVWNIFTQTTRADTGDVIDASTGRIAMDRASGAAVKWDKACYADQLGQACDPGNIDYSGQLYAFPFGTKKQTYQYYDTTLRKALPMIYQGTETVRGLTTYRFVQAIPDQQINADEATMDVLLGSLAPGAASGTMWYDDTRTLWIEPVTGSIVNYSEQQHRTLRTDTGTSITLLDATFQYTPQTLAEVTKQAGDGRQVIVALSRYTPIGLTVLGLVALLLGFLLTRSGVRTKAT